jgi:sugar lactone lactonase YvrE
MPTEPTVDAVMFVADRTADRIVRFDAETGAFEGELVAIDRPSSVRLGDDGALYVAGFGDSEVIRLDASTGALLGQVFRDTTILEEPVELVFHDGDLVVLGHDTHNAIVIDPTGSAVHDVGYPEMRGAHDFVFGPDGLLYVATEHEPAFGTAMQIWDVEAGALVGRFGTLDQLANATGVAIAGDALYVTDYERGALLRFDGDRPTVLATDLTHPIALEPGPDGLLYVVDDTGIHRYTLDGGRVETVVARSPDLVGPRSLTFVPRALL